MIPVDTAAVGSGFKRTDAVSYPSLRSLSLQEQPRQESSDGTILGGILGPEATLSPQSPMGDLSSSFTRSEDDIFMLESALRGRNEIIKKLESRVQLDQMQRNQDQERIRALEARLKRLDEELAASNRKTSNLSQELVTLRPEFHQAKHREKTLKDELDQSREMVKHLERQNTLGQNIDIRRLTTSLDQHKRELTTLRPALHNAMGRIGYLEGQLHQSQQEVVRLKSQLQRNENILHHTEAELYKRSAPIVAPAVPPRMMLANIQNTGLPFPLVPRREVAAQTTSPRRKDASIQTATVKFKGKAVQTYRSLIHQGTSELGVSGSNYSEDSEEDHSANVTPLTDDFGVSVSSPTSSQDSGESAGGEPKKKKRLSGAARRKLRKMWQQEAELNASREQSPLLGRLMSAESPLTAIIEEDEPRPIARSREVEGPSSMPVQTFGQP